MAGYQQIDVDGERYGRQDTVGTLNALAPWWEQLADGRRLPARFDALVADQTEVLARALAEPVTEVSLAGLWPLGGRVTAAVRAGTIDAAPVLTESLRLLRRAGDVLREAGAMPYRAVGEVVQVNGGVGGVPKLPLPGADIDRGGLVGDRQATRRHHGRPWQALCLWSAEVIDGLATAGHPIGYGFAGENLTIRGLPWTEVRAGVRIRVGTALAECALFALPCRANAHWFADGDFHHMHHGRGPVSRVYARVLEPGRVAPGDPAVLEP